MSTITGMVTNGVTLGQAGYTSPLKITGGGAVSNSAGAAVYASGIYANVAVVNQGTIIDTAGFDAVELKDGGSVNNKSKGALIQGNTGVDISGAAGTVTNAGTIAGTGHYSGGVLLGAGGYVANAGLIQGSGFGGVGVIIDGSAGTVTNSGTIAGPSGRADGVVFSAGGSVGNTGLIQGFSAVFISGAAGTVTNSGTIVANGFGRSVYLGAGGSVGNTGLIQGFNGVEIYGAAGTVTNSGTIVGLSGVYLGAGGSVGNTGLISRIEIGGAAGTVGNSGTIIGIGPSVFLGAGGSVANTALIQGDRGVSIDGAGGTVANSGTIAGTDSNSYGVALYAGGTVVDSGTITGGSGTAISFGGVGGNLLALEHGYKLGGGVSVAGTANTLELLGTAGAVTVDFDKPGAGFTNFATVTFGAANGHNETLTITDTAALPGTISGFTQLNDIIDLTQLGPKGTTATLNGSDQLVVSNSSQSVSLQLDPSENYSGVVWKTNPDGKGGTDVTVQKAGPSPLLALTSPTAPSFGFDDISGVPGSAGGPTGPPAGIMPVAEGNGGALLFPLPGGGMTAVIDFTSLHDTLLG